jgi:hypothetical protein
VEKRRSAVAAATAATTAPEPPGSGVSEAGPPPAPGEADHLESETQATVADPGVGPLPPDAWTSPTELLWRRWLLWTIPPVTGLLIAAGVWSLVASGTDDRPNPENAATAEDEAASGSPSTEAEAAEDGQSPGDPSPNRWIPPQSRFVVCARPPAPGELDWLRQAAARAGAPWPAEIDRLMGAMGSSPRAIAEVTWASTDLRSWTHDVLVVVRLAEGHKATGLKSAGNEIDLRVGQRSARQFKSGTWPLPYVVLDERTLATGSRELLAGLESEKSTESKEAAVGKLWEALPPEASLRMAVDLQAARQAGWPMPDHLLDVWPAGAQPWHTLWHTPRAMGLSLQLESGLRGQVGLDCNGATAAIQVKAAIDELIPAARRALEATMQSLPGRLERGPLTAEQGEAYGRLLERAAVGLRGAQWEVADDTVWFLTQWPEVPGQADALLAEGRPAARADWLAAAEAADRRKHDQILSGLAAYDQTQGHFPEGAAGGKLMPPETRLGWIAQLLPYFDRAEWHGQLQFSYPWNGPQNRKITRQPLPAVVNPGLGPSRTEAGFPVTHYVGVAGVGEDAGNLPADHPRAGVFGYGRTASPTEIPDGASNTIATLGVTEALGPWAAGGNASVRSLTKRPYVNGPDGFGSGQPNGMLAGMADGSVRYLSKDVDPRVLEQLATAAGGEAASGDMLAADRQAAKADPPGDSAEAADTDDPGAEEMAEHDRPSQAESPADGEPDLEQADQPQGEPLPSVNAAELLSVEVPALEVADQPLIEFVRAIESMAGVAVTFDLDAMQRLGVGLDDPISVRVVDASLTDILRAGLAERGLDLAVDGSLVLATAPAEQQGRYREVRYSVGDLTDGDPARTKGLRDRIVRLVAPDSWKDTGGRGTIKAEEGALVVDQTEPVHYDVLVFCEKLRNARGRSLRSRLDRDRFVLASRTSQADALLQKTLTVNFHEPTPLRRIVRSLSGLVPGRIVVNWAALRFEGLGPETKGSVAADGAPLGNTLAELLAPLGLACRAVDDRLLEITTARDLAARLELEFYPVGPLLAGQQNAEALVERIKSEVAGDTWADVGGPGVIVFDRPAECLLVLQSQPVQRRLEAFLESLGGTAGR